MTIGQRLKNLREDKDLSQQEVARALGVSREAVKMWENDERDIKTQGMIALADFYNVSVDYLLGRVECKSMDLDLQTVCSKTGLTQQAYENLRASADKQYIINLLLNNNSFFRTAKAFREITLYRLCKDLTPKALDGFIIEEKNICSLLLEQIVHALMYKEGETPTIEEKENFENKVKFYDSYYTIEKECAKLDGPKILDRIIEIMQNYDSEPTIKKEIIAKAVSVLKDKAAEGNNHAEKETFSE